MRRRARQRVARSPPLLRADAASAALMPRRRRAIYFRHIAARRFFAITLLYAADARHAFAFLSPMPAADYFLFTIRRHAVLRKSLITFGAMLFAMSARRRYFDALPCHAP